MITDNLCACVQWIVRIYFMHVLSVVYFLLRFLEMRFASVFLPRQRRTSSEGPGQWFRDPVNNGHTSVGETLIYGSLGLNRLFRGDTSTFVIFWNKGFRHRHAAITSFPECALCRSRALLLHSEPDCNTNATTGVNYYHLDCDDFHLFVQRRGEN